MKKLLMLACVLAIATSAVAAQDKIKASYSGVIEKYDAATKTLTVKRKDKQGEFVISTRRAGEQDQADGPRSRPSRSTWNA